MIDINISDRLRAISLINDLGLRVVSVAAYGNRLYIQLADVPAGFDNYLAAELAT